MLPADKVIIGSSSKDIISPVESRKLSELMKKYDVDLDSGLSYLSGNMTRFRTLANIFSDGYEHDRERLENMFNGGSDRLIFEWKRAAEGMKLLVSETFEKIRACPFVVRTCHRRF